MAENLGEATLEVTGDASGATKAIDDTSTHLGASIFIFRTAGYALQSIGQSILSGLQSASQAAADYNQTLMKIQNLSSLADLDINKVHDSLLAMATETGKTPQELADGFYFAASVLNDMNTALAVTEAAAKGSTLGLGDMTDVTKLLTSITNVYGLTAGQVNDVINTLIIGVKDGAVESDELAGAMGRIIPVAKIAGVSFQDITAAVATATRSGLSAEEATTAINRALVEMIGSTMQTNKELYTLGFSQDKIDDAMQSLAVATGTVTDRLSAYGVKAKDADLILGDLNTNQDMAVSRMQKLGLTTDQINSVIGTHSQQIEILRQKLIPYGLTLQDIDQVIRTYTKDHEEGELALGKFGISADELRQTLRGPDGLYNALKMIMDATGGNEAELRRIFPNIRGLIGILSTAGTQGDEYKSILDEMHGATNTLNEDFNRTTQTQAFAMAQEKATMEALKVQAGEALQPTVIAFLKALTPLLQDIGKFAEEHPKAFEIIVLGLAGIGGALYGLGTISQGIAGWLAIERGFKWLIGTAEKSGMITSALSGIGGALRGLGLVLAGSFGWVAILVAIAAALAILLIWNPGDWRTKVWNAIKAIGDGLVVSLKNIAKSVGDFFSNLGTQIQNGIQGIGPFFSSLGTWVHDAMTNVKNAIGDVFSNLGTTVHDALMSLWDKITGVWNGIVGGAERAWSEFSSRPLYWITRVVLFVPGQLYQLYGRIVRWFEDLIGRAAAWATNMFNNMVNWVIQLPGHIATWLTNTLNAIVKWGSDTLDWITTNGTNLLNSFIAWVKELPGNFATWLTNTLNTIIKWGQDTWNSVTTTMTNVFNTVLDWLKKLPGQFGTWLANTVSAVVTWGTNLVTAAAKAIGDFFGGIGYAITHRDWAGLGRQIIQGIGQGIVNMVKNLGGLLGAAASQIIDGIKDAFGISSPSKVMAEQVGAPMVLGIVAGLRANAHLVRNAIADVTNVPLGTMAFTAGVSAGAARSSVTGAASGGGVNIGEMNIHNPSAEVDLISALRRAEYLKRMGGRGIAPAPVA